MNTYYHEFSVGFNFWYLLIPAIIVAGAVIGQKRYKLVGKGIYESIPEPVVFGYAVLSGIVLFVLIYLESMDGLIQWYDNGLQVNESPIWSVVFAGDTIAAIAAAVGVLTFHLSRYISERRYDELKNEIRRQERMERRRRRSEEKGRAYSGQERWWSEPRQRK